MIEEKLVILEKQGCELFTLASVINRGYRRMSRSWKSEPNLASQELAS